MSRTSRNLERRGASKASAPVPVAGGLSGGLSPQQKLVEVVEVHGLETAVPAPGHQTLQLGSRGPPAVSNDSRKATRRAVPHRSETPASCRNEQADSKEFRVKEAHRFGPLPGHSAGDPVSSHPRFCTSLEKGEAREQLIKRPTRRRKKRRLADRTYCNSNLPGRPRSVKPHRRRARWLSLRSIGSGDQ